MSNRLAAKDFGLKLEEVLLGDGARAKLALAGIPVFSLRSVRAYQERMLRRANKPKMVMMLALTCVVAVVSLAVFAVGLIGALMFRWPAELAAGAFISFIASAAVVYLGLYGSIQYFQFYPGSAWTEVYAGDASMPSEIRERYETVRRLFPQDRIYVEALRLDPFIFVEVQAEERTICFGVWDEREGEYYFA